MGGSAHHEPFKALGPISWPTELAGRPDSDLQALLTSTFSDAQTLVDSIPIPPNVAAAHKTAGRARSATDSVVTSGHGHHGTGSHQHPLKLSAEAAETATKLRKEWKECKVSSPKENPLGINVYKLSSKDGKGAWFARRSVHKDVGFDKWRAGLEKEFAESIKRYMEKGTEPGTGNIRGIGGERRIERVFLVSARFPGPTTPRDFVTCLMMPGPSAGGSSSRKGPRQPRQFMLVSRPCEHPDAPARSNFIRGQYESVEVIREIPLDRSLRKTKSSTELSREEFHEMKDALDQAGVDDIKKEAVLRSAKQASVAAADGADDRGRSSFKGDEDDHQQFAVEWLMVTRSDPGGSVPRFMVERGTPGGITNDAARFVDWLSTKSIEELTGSSDDEVPEKTVEAVPTPGATTTAPNHIKRKEVPVQQKRAPGVVKVDHGQSPLRQTEAVEEETLASPSSGLYGMLTGALGAAGNAVANKVSNFAGTTNDTEDDTASVASSASSSDIESDTSSIRSFVSATEGEGHAVNASGQSLTVNSANGDLTNNLTNATSIRSDLSATESASSLQPITTGENGSIHLPDHYAARREKHEKEVRKLEERHRKAEEKLHRLQAKQAAKRREQEEKGLAAAAAAAALDDDTASKHSKSSKAAHEDARLAKLEQHRLREERKAKEKLRKAAEKEEKANVLREMEKVKAERDLALRQMEMLREQVGELQRQNTMLAARLGKYEGPGAPGAVAAGSETVAGESQAPVKNGNGVVGA
ncbi:hypothetical protein QBC32DRAFT_258089 [Pseudoneurospora amorphoporcata]|uniref:DUF3074 domain-containing protein n=1 Tax=Pseudoneurospora amorphoporcata TaxID=241081 RepID=A0AAN6NYI5_9PEZI|nr:hypothetical protein QBC32DRAFT_258089 [Pseudoneurospora amorphoporcata]